jgi:hypothetical protein
VVGHAGGVLSIPEGTADLAKQRAGLEVFQLDESYLGHLGLSRALSQNSVE